MTTQNEFDEDKFLYDATENPGKIAQYDRIMSRKLRDSINSFTDNFVKQTQALKDSIDTFNSTNSKLSGRLLVLNIVLVFLTIILVIFGAIQIFLKLL